MLITPRPVNFIVGFGSSMIFRYFHTHMTESLKTMSLLLGRNGFLILMVTACLGLSSCKDEDMDPPAVSLGVPGSGFSIEANSEFRIAGRATDDRGVTQVTAILYETSTETVVRTHSENFQGAKVDFDFTMAAGDRYTDGGEYTLMVRAMDAAQNTGSAFQQVTIYELPLAYRGLYWAGEGSGNLHQIHWRDTTGTIHAGPGGLYSLSDLLVDSRNDQVVASMSLDGALWGWDATDFTNIFHVNLAEGIGTETYSGISMNRKGYYTSLRVPPYLRGYRSDGSAMGNFDDALYPATAVLATADKVYLGVQGVLGSPTKVDVYNGVSRALESTEVVDWRIDHIVDVDDAQIAVCGNRSGLGQILVLDKTSLVRNEVTELTEPIMDMVSAGGRVWVLTAGGLHEYFVSAGSLSPLLAGGSYECLGVDAAQARIFLGKQDAIEVRTWAGSLVEEIAGAFGRVHRIRARYNK